MSGMDVKRRQYFGTDGIRGLVGKAPITPDFVIKLGWSIGRYFVEHNPGQENIKCPSIRIPDAKSKIRGRTTMTYLWCKF